MSMLSLRFSRAIEGGRHRERPRDTRETLLVALLNKRATAYRLGAHDLDEMLRDQIRWSLPVQFEPVD
jgi:hypothetical protein